MKYYPGLIIRILLCFIPFSLFSLILTPLTIKGISLFLTFHNPTITNNLIQITNYSFKIVEACIATLAYIFLFWLTILTKDLTIKNRIQIILTGFGLLYIINLARMTFMVDIALLFGWEIFNKIHLIIYQVISGIYVAFIWIFLVYLFNIKSIPVYSDLKELYNKSIFKKN